MIYDNKLARIVSKELNFKCFEEIACNIHFILS